MSYYETLEVSPNASQAVIKAAYKSLMQRYHPDKNPDDTATAQHAIRVGQAYEVLSDEAKRAAYDAQLQRRLPAHTDDTRRSGEFLSRRPVFKSRRDVTQRKYYWIGWLLILVTISSSLWFLSKLQQKRSPEAELSEIRLSLDGMQLTRNEVLAKLTRRDDILEAHPELIPSERRKEDAARTIPSFITDLEVDLNSAGGISGGTLRIPVLGTTLGSFDAKQFKLYLSENKGLIRRSIEAKLATAQYEDLIKTDGEEHLQAMILDAIGQTTSTDRFKNYPASLSENPGRYGIVEVFLPKSFSVTATAGR